MPKLVCVSCEQELVPKRNEVKVVEYADFGPYKLWEADEWICPNCGTKIIAGFSMNAKEHYMDGFQEELEAIPPDLLREDFESQRQRWAFKGKNNDRHI